MALITIKELLKSPAPVPGAVARGWIKTRRLNATRNAKRPAQGRAFSGKMVGDAGIEPATPTV